ncbi:MAG: phage holin family protein [Prosthecobacter sp.]
MHTSPAIPHSPPVLDVRDSVRSLLGSASLYLEARLRIARLEGREALRAGARVAVLGVVLMLSLLVAYAGLMLGLAWWITHTWGEGGAVSTVLVLILGHLVVAAGCGMGLVHALRRSRFFHATRKEFMEDKRWLEAHQAFRN